MAEREPIDNTAGGQGEAGADGIDAALDKASRLTQGLLSELGGPGRASVEEAPATRQGEQAAPVQAPTGEPGLPDAGPVDDQLTKVEGLLEEAQAQIGGGTDSGDGAAESKASSESVSETTAAAARPEGGRKPGAHPTMGDLGDLEGVGEAPTLTAIAPPPGAAQPQPTAPSEETKSCETPAEPAAASAPPVHGWRRVPCRAVAGLCAGLDLVDRPFANVSYGVRQILGLCAVVTILAAIAVLAIAHFR